MTIKEAREKKGISQDRLSKLLGITLRYYQSIEYGKHVPSVVVGLLLSEILEVSLYDLFSNKLKEYKESKKFT